MEALLHGGDAQPQTKMQATSCEQSWQAPTDFPADSYGSGQRQIPLRQPVVSKEACLKGGARGSNPNAATEASQPRPMQDLQPAREVTELKARASAAEDSPDWSREAAEAAQNMMHDALDVSQDIQGPSTPAGRAGRDQAKQDTAKHRQPPEMTSLLQQDMASLKAQVRPPAHMQAFILCCISGSLSSVDVHPDVVKLRMSVSLSQKCKRATRPCCQ